MNVKKVCIFTAACLSAFLLISCNGKKSVSTKSFSEKKGVLKVPEFNVSVKDVQLSKGAVHTDAHAQYLDDSMDFKELSSKGLKEKDTAVVGSHVALLYQDDFFKFSELSPSYATLNTEENVKTEPVEFGTIVKITGLKIENSEPLNSYVKNMFDFQDNWNWFYPVETEDGRKGYIYGADLKGLDDTRENNEMTAMLYKKDGRLDDFYPYVGYTAISDAIKEGLQKNKLVMQLTVPETYVHPDDMVQKYNELRYKKFIPVFITTDLIAHCQHLIFDRMLQYTEEEFFRPRLKELCECFISALEKTQNIEVEYIQAAKDYFEVARLLLSDTAEMENLSAAVKADYENIMNASGFGIEEIFDIEEDFSQYKPRGHYTKSEELKSYFRAQMWFGRLGFIIASSDVKNVDSEKLLKTAKTALLICNLVQEDNSLYVKWQTVFDPVTDLIGFSDDLSFKEILPLYNEQKVPDFSLWFKEDSNVLDFMKLCHEKLRPPLISGNSVFTGTYEITEGEDSEQERKPPMNWRLMGQRFTWDSFIHQQVCAPKLFSRDFVKGLDVMKVFGSRTAEVLLTDEYSAHPGLKEILDGLQSQFDSYSPDFWQQTYYNQILYQIKSMATFEQGAGFYFTETPAWNIKSQISSHAVWAELRHDTILYAKQTYAERAGDGDYEPTFRTDPVPLPVNYIEPNLNFFEISINSIKKLMDTYYIYDLLDEESKWCLRSLIEAYEKMYQIVLLEIKDEPISKEQNSFIRTVSSIFGNLILIHANNGYIEDTEKLKMALIADVFTNAEKGLCLETGTGVPVRYYIPLNDGQGGKRIAVGYGFSYYEFLQPISNRLNDEEWKELVYKKQNEIFEKMPEWERKCFIQDDNLISNSWYY